MTFHPIGSSAASVVERLQSQIIRLRHYPDNREFAATLVPLADRWGWILENVSAEFNCDQDDIGTQETDDEGDLITVRGEPVARIERRYS